MKNKPVDKNNKGDFGLASILPDAIQKDTEGVSSYQNSSTKLYKSRGAVPFPPAVLFCTRISTRMTPLAHVGVDLPR